MIYLVVRSVEAGPAVWAEIVRPQTWHLIVRTMSLVGAVTAASTLVSLPLAWLTSSTDLPFRRVWAILGAVPLAIPSYVGAFALIAALGPRGILQQWLQGPFGVERLPDFYGFPGAFLALTLFTYPYLFLNIRGALVALDPALEEVSRSLGHDRWTTFRRVTLPQLRPAIASGALLVALYTLSDFGAVSMLQYNTFTRAIFIHYKAAFDRSYAAALSLILVMLAVGILWLEMRIRSRTRYHRSDSGSRRKATPVKLGAWRWPALAFCAGIVSLSLLLPAGVITYWLVRGLAAGNSVTSVWIPAWNSFHASAVAAGAAVLVALPPVMLAVRHPHWLSRALDRLTYVGYGLPGIVIALGLVFFGANYARPLYQTFVLLILAYVIRFLPQAVGAVRTSLLQVNPRVEEAARSLGRSQIEVLAGITWPLVRPGILSGAALVFLTVMKELPITLLLSPIGFRTLATTVWGATEEAFYTQAALPALFVLLISSLSLISLNNRIER